MATQTVAFQDGHLSVGHLDIVRPGFNALVSSGGLLRGNKLGTNNSPSESVHNCVHAPKAGALPKLRSPLHGNNCELADQRYKT
jgi:hypothetical protein